MTISRENIKDAGLALILILLIVALKFDLPLLTGVAMAVSLMCMIVPRLLTPFAWFWFGLSHVLSPIMSRVVLFMIYITVVAPIGFLRKILGADPMDLKKWKKGSESVFVDRNHTFSKTDLEHPY